MPRPLGPPPDERPNWGRLNEGQRRYAWEQYNLAKVRRGIQVDHPIPDSENNQPTESVQERPPTEAPINTQDVDNTPEEAQVDDFDIDEVLDRPIDPDILEAAIDDLGLRGMSEAVSSSAGGSKRDGGAQGGITKRQRTATAGTSLPGTAGGMGGESMEQAVEPIPRPMYSAHKQIRHFRKVHRILTFGLAYKPIAVSRTGPPAYSDVFMVTSLAHIPWEYPFMYLNPSEFNLLPAGSRCVKARCQIKAENVRIAFPTNSTDTNLATLNQNKFLRVGIGLNQKLQSVNAQPGGFAASSPMVATTVTPFNGNTLQLWANNFYGVSNDDTTQPDIFTTQTPRHQFGIPWVAQHYFMPVTQTNDPTFSGWEDMQATLEEVKVDGPSGTIVDETFVPSMGILKQPLTSIWTGLPSAAVTAASRIVPVNNGAGNTQHRRINTTVQNGVVVGNTEVFTDWTTSLAPNYTLIQPIEKNQRLCAGVTPDYNSGTQQTIHVGVMPVPALTTSAIDNAVNNSSFTDSQAYFEIICDMEVECSFPTRRPLATQANVGFSNNIFQRVGAGDTDYSNTMAYGLFQTTA